MSINVTVNGNHLNIRRGRMVLSDLEQIKKNERDRRRRLRLEQVRQQSKEISDRLLERAKNIAKEELKKLEKDDKFNLKHHEKVMEVQRKYQEDMADIGQAFVRATLEPDPESIIRERGRKNKLVALKRGKEALKQIRSMPQDTAQQQHKERLHRVREVEDLRSSMIAKLAANTVPEKDTVCISAEMKSGREVKQDKVPKRTVKKCVAKKLPGKVTKSYIKVLGSDLKVHSPLIKSKAKISEISSRKDSSTIEERESNLDAKIDTAENDEKPLEEVPKKDERIRYNPEDYVQTSNTTSSNSSSDDSSYFSDNNGQCTIIETTKLVKCPATEKVQLYDHSKRQTNTYDKPLGIVEKIQTWDEPSALDLAAKIKETEAAETQLSENRKYNAQKRGEDAALREKVRRDYKTLIQTLNQLSNEERRLKASDSKSVHTQEFRRIRKDQHKKKLNHAVKSLLNGECPEQCVSYQMERQITLSPKGSDKSDDAQASWEEPCYDKRKKISQSRREEMEESREEQILDMLKKVERQKRLLLKEFGVDLPDDVLSASMKPLFEREKSIQTEDRDAKPEKPGSPEVRVINVAKKDVEDEIKEKSSPAVRKVEIAVQTTTGDEESVSKDKGTQVELTETKSESVDKEIETVYPIEPKVIIVRPETESDLTSSLTTNALNDSDKQISKATPKKKKRHVKTAKRTPSKILQKPCRSSKSSKRSVSKPNAKESAEEVSDKGIRMYVNKGGFNIEVKPTQVREVTVDVSTQSSQIHSPNIPEQTIKPRWIQSQSRIHIKDFSDASTTFASPPPVKPRDVLEVLNNVSILELLDSSASERMRALRKDVSPVSTPETPSPRTMNLPSNIPHPDKIRRLLKQQSRGLQTTSDSLSLSSIKNNSSTEFSDRQPSESHRKAELPRSPISFCLCNNPECNEMHAKFDEIRTYALKNCPEILQKYEDLQTTCAERIISLTNLIEKVRNEQKGMELSITSPADETSFMQLPSRVTTDDLQSVRKLVENIEAIHNQLAKTLIESQKIVDDKAQEDSKESEDASKAKPKIISKEKVDIPLDRLKPRTLTTSTPKPASQLQQKHYEQEMIDKLSKEILEQSKSFNNLLTTQKTMHSIETETSTSTDVIDSAADPSQKQKKNKDFIPFPSDFPKISKTVNTATCTNGRSKPPVSLLSGPYRSEIDSSGHELSTIIEFDTPDTINKSQNQGKSPSSMKKAVKPAEDVLSLNLRNQRVSEKKSSPIRAQRTKEFANGSSEDKDEKLERVQASNEKVKYNIGNQVSLQMEESIDAPNKDKITSTSSNSFSELSGISQIASTPSSTMLKYAASSPEEMETALKKLGLGWAITTLKKTREASALSSSSNSDVAPLNAAKRMSPVKKQFDNNYGLPDISDVSSISIKEASKSTEQAVLLKGRTSTPKLPNSNSNSTASNSNSSNTNGSEIFQEATNGLIIPSITLTKTKSNIKKLEDL